MNRWPNWFREESAPMRAALTSRATYTRCVVCRLLRPCRYDFKHDVFICSEECWEERKNRETSPVLAQAFKMTDVAG